MGTDAGSAVCFVVGTPAGSVLCTPSGSAVCFVVGTPAGNVVC